MTSIREVLNQFLHKRQVNPTKPSELSYTVHWTEVVREWTPEQRCEVKRAVERIASDPNFMPNEFGRLYPLPEVDDVKHSGSSLMTLLKVLEAFNVDEV